MQTYILNVDLAISASQLDTRRLGCQIKEAMQIYKANFENGPRQGNPYAYEMWMDYPKFLMEYGIKYYLEWQGRFVKGKRGGKLRHKSGDGFFEIGRTQGYSSIRPPWLTEEFASSHRAILLGKTREKFIRADFVDNHDCSKKSHRLYMEAKILCEWYQQWHWPEQPAQRVDGKWPYLWPEVA